MVPDTSQYQASTTSSGCTLFSLLLWPLFLFQIAAAHAYPKVHQFSIQGLSHSSYVEKDPECSHIDRSLA